jgi:hypothetical protein
MFLDYVVDRNPEILRRLDHNPGLVVKGCERAYNDLAPLFLREISWQSPLPI